MVAITKFDREHIFDAVKLMYTSVANQPEKEFHFPTGRSACEYVGYPNEHLDKILPAAMESFAGVGYPFGCDVIQQGDVVLDIGAGAGTDVLLSAILTGPEGKVYGLDMTRAMHEKLNRNKDEMGMAHVEPIIGNAEEIPLEDNSIDVVTSNGVLNLVPDKFKAFDEIYRVLKPGGRIQISDIVIHKHFDALDASKANPQLWAECIVGAMHENDYIEALGKAGFSNLAIIDRVDYFAASSSDSTRETAEYFETESITIKGIK